MIKAEVVAHSKSPQGHELVSILATFPRIILAEVNTHRMLSKNTSSSRAIPFKKMVQSVKDNPFIPIAWQKNHPGMQGTEYITDPHAIDLRTQQWLLARDNAVDIAEAMSLPLETFGGEIIDDGSIVTKQLCNRLLEPFMWTTMLITGNLKDGGWDNFFDLRCPQYRYISLEGKKQLLKSKEDWLYIAESNHEDIVEYNRRSAQNPLFWFELNEGLAEIHMMALAECIYEAINGSTPKELKAGEWHIPFEDKLSTSELVAIAQNKWDSENSEWKHYFGPEIIDLSVKVSTAMGARTSYTIVGEEKAIDYNQLIGLDDRLLNQWPPHSSPMEHCSVAMNDEEYRFNIKGTIDSDRGVCDFLIPENTTGWCRNFRGFIQRRHLIETNHGRS